MKDQQIKRGGAEPRIFLVSPILHCVSMTVLVYLRSSFGYAYLRPKSIFFAVTWAFILYAVYAWIDGDVWQQYRAALWYGIAAAALYWLHLLATVRRELNETAAHDNFLGVSNFQKFAGGKDGINTALNEGRFRLWGEPLIVIAVALTSRTVFSEYHLSLWLLVAGSCLWAKETLNHWFGIRHRKRRKDMLEDAEDVLGDQSSNVTRMQPSPYSSTRKEKVRRVRTRSS